MEPPETAKQAEAAGHGVIPETDLHRGLAAQEAATRRDRFGPNALQEKHESLAVKLLHNFGHASRTSAAGCLHRRTQRRCQADPPAHVPSADARMRALLR